MKEYESPYLKVIALPSRDILTPSDPAEEILVFADEPKEER